jgi:cholesterol oxidase
VSAAPGTLDLHSLAALRAAYRAAPDPELALLVGDHESEFVGPRWLRMAAPLGMRVGRMAGWCGKRFDPDEDGDGVLQGVNRVLREGVRADAIPITARIEPSLMDGRPAIAVAYPADAPFPWPRVRDELRALGEGTLLGMTFHMPLAPPAGTPFLLHRR